MLLRIARGVGPVLASWRTIEEGDWFASMAENFIHEISGVPGAELFQQVGSMEIDGTRADAECPSDLHQRGVGDLQGGAAIGQRGAAHG